jgi:hypothetical protein
MKTTSPLPRLLAHLLTLGLLLAHARPAEVRGPVLKLPDVVVTAPRSGEFIGPYQQPRWSARGRFSGDTDAYVLPPWSFFADLDYQLTVPRHGRASHLFTQELELGLPYRFQIAYENNFEVMGRRAQTTVQTIEARWAPANWGKIPLNPTLFAEYKFGIGQVSGEREEDDGAGEPKEAGEAEERETGGKEAEADEARGKEAKAKPSERHRTSSSHIPNSFEVRLLLAEQFGAHTQWALNLFHEHELGGDRENETGFSQALSYSLKEETLRAGIEMQFIRRTERDSRNDPAYEFNIGPSLAIKPSRRTRLDVAALFGTTDDSPTLKLFTVFSIDFGPATETEVEAPVSMRNR